MSDFTALKATFKGDLVIPSDPNYLEAIARWAKNATRQANIVAFVKDNDDVRAAIAYARNANLPLAIRGGGHSTAGSSSTEGGLVIDLSRYLNGVKVDAEKKLVYIQGGALWKSVDEEAIKHGLATVGGTVNHTGVGGFILGGGYGWLSGMHGLAIDCLVQATVVTADGSVLTANDTENPDLFWGLRGGGCNFGVCTEFVMQLFPQRPTVFAGFVVFPPPLREAIATVADARLKIDRDPNEAFHVLMMRMPTNGQPCIMVLLFYNGSEAAGRENFKDIYALNPILDLAREIPFEQVNGLLNDNAVHGNNMYFRSLFSSGALNDISAAAFDRVLEISGPQAENAKPQVFPAIVCDYTPLQNINSVPDDATPYRRNLRNNLIVNIAWLEDTPGILDLVRKTASELAGLLGQGPADIGYGNLSPDSTDIPATEPIDKAKTLYGHHYPRLQEIKKKYDPDVIFDRWFAIKPAA